MTQEQLANRNAAIKAAWDDPLLRALASAARARPDAIRATRESYNAYHRRYQQAWRRRRKDSHEPLRPDA